MRIGILGTGFMGKMHAGIFKGFSDVTVTGMAGRDEAKTAEVAETLGIAAYANFDDLINSMEVDAIDVCLPSSVHAEYVIAALNKGKHVFCETPLAYSMDDAERMLSAAKANDRILMVALFDRFHCMYRYIYDNVKTGRLGKPKAVFANRRSPAYWASPDICVNLMIHDFDFIYWLLGQPGAVIGLGTRTAEGNDENVQALLEYEGVSVMVEGGTVMPGSFPFSTSLRVVCERGAYELNWHWSDQGPVGDLTLYPEEGAPEKPVVAEYDPYQAECRYFVDAVAGKVDPELLGIETAYHSLKMAVRARESVRRQGHKITIES